MARTSNKDRDANEMIMGTFRIKSGTWENFKRLASQNDVTATDLIISFIETCLQSQSIPQPQPLQDIPRSNLDDIYTYIDNKLDKDIDHTIKKAISESLEDGAIGEAIAKSYEATMGQFNGLLQEIETLKSKIDNISKNPSISNDQSPITNDQSPVTSPQPPITRSLIENIRTSLRRKEISATTEQIRAAFAAAGWDGSNFQEIRKDILERFS